jgi:hypothetical protein
MTRQSRGLKQTGEHFKIRSVSDGKRMGVGPHAD